MGVGAAAMDEGFGGYGDWGSEGIDSREGREVFCCGPEPYMQAVRNVLQAAGFDMRRYHEESFTIPVHDVSETRQHSDVQIEAGRSASVRFATSAEIKP